MPGKGKPFVPNDPRINRDGRPVGATDKKWNDVRWWFTLITENYEKMKPREKVDAGLRGLSLLISKMPNLPKDPDESLERAKSTQEQEKELDEAELNADIEP